ncbi:MAG: hypothetical protein V9G10_08405 [Candidatus Nanopelagicales bacterium]
MHGRKFVVVFVAAVTQCLVLDGAADPVQALVGVFDQVERVDHQRGLGQDLAVDAAIRAGHVQGADRDRLEPGLGALFQPADHRFGVPAFGDIEQPVPGHVSEGGCPPLFAVGPVTVEQRFVHPDRVHLPDPVGVINQLLAVADHGVVDGMPVTAQLLGHGTDRPPVAAHLLGQPACPDACRAYLTARGMLTLQF